MQVIAHLRKLPYPPRKMRLVADLIRGKQVVLAGNILKHQSRQCAQPMHKLLLSAISNFQQKAIEETAVEALYITQVYVDGGSMAKRIKPAPQGRAHRIRRRTGHITITLGTLPSQT